MINLFQISQQDQSVFYLSQIYGFVGNLLPANNAPLLVGIMFKVLNTMALTIGAFLVVYVIIVGLLKTAQEGEFLGKQWNSLWIPIRTVIGIAALFPTSTGYSAIQVIIMWIILQGVGAADTLWTKVLEYINVAGSPYAQVTGMGNLASMSVNPNMQQIFQSLTCQASAKATYPAVKPAAEDEDSINYYCGTGSDGKPNHGNSDFCKTTKEDMLNPITGSQVAEGSYTYYMGPSGECGSLKYCDSSKTGLCADDQSPACLSCKAQHDALQKIIPTLGAVADQIVTVDHDYLTFYNQGTWLPNWVRDYCTAKGVPASQCCYSQDSNSICNNDIFPSPQHYNASSAKSSDPLDPSIAATNLYLKYPLQVYLNGSDFINAAVGEYTAGLVGAVSQNIQNKMENTALKDWMVTAQSNGWILAGGFYYKLASMNADNDTAVTTDLVFLPTPMAKDNNEMTTFRNNNDAVASLVDKMTNKNASASPTFAGPPGMSGDISDALDNGKYALMQSWQNNLTANKLSQQGAVVGTATNPLISVATFGYQLMIIAQLLFAVIVVAIAYLVGTAAINPMVLGTGFTLNPFGEAVKAVAGFMGPFFTILITSMYSIGALLAIYVPLIPYMVFTVGAIGWLIATVEAMVAGPIIALGILSPGGQHDILGRAEPAMMQLLNLFLRPSLMIIGMMVSMLMSIVVVDLVNAGFMAVSTQVIKSPGLFEQILFIAAYTSFLVTALNKTFSLIYIIPERVLTWIGGPAVQYGEAEALGATKQAVEGAAGAAAGAAKEAGGGVMGGVQGYRQAGMEEGKRKEDAAAKIEAEKAKAASERKESGVDDVD